MLVSHLPCSLPPNQWVICLAPYHQTSQSFDLPSTTASLCHCITVLVICLGPCHQTSQSFALPLPPIQSVIWLALYHRITMTLHQIFHTTLVWIWLVNANQHSSDWLIVPTTANQITGIEKPNYHKTQHKRQQLQFFSHIWPWPNDFDTQLDLDMYIYPQKEFLCEGVKKL